MIKNENLIFDFGGTLARMVPSREKICQDVLKELGYDSYSTEEIERAYSTIDFHYNNIDINIDLNKIIRKEHYSKYNYQLLLYIGIENIYNKFNLELQSRINKEKKWIVYDDVICVLRDLMVDKKHDKYKLYILSNWDSSLERICKDNGIYELFEGIYSSWQLGVSKPYKRFFYNFKELVNIDNGTYIGDNYFTDIVTSRKCGFDAILIDRNNRYKNTDCKKISDLYDLYSL